MNRLMAKRCAACSLDKPPTTVSDLRAIFPAHRQDRRELDHDLEHLAALVVEVEQVAGQDQVAGAGDGQEFGKTFDDAENGGFEQQ